MYVKLETSRKRFGYREVSVKVRVIEQSPNPSQTFTSMVVNCDRKELTIKLIIRSKAGKLINSNDYGGGIVKPVGEDGNEGYAIWDRACNGN